MVNDVRSDWATIDISGSQPARPHQAAVIESKTNQLLIALAMTRIVLVTSAHRQPAFAIEHARAGAIPYARVDGADRAGGVGSGACALR